MKFTHIVQYQITYFTLNVHSILYIMYNMGTMTLIFYLLSPQRETTRSTALVDRVLMSVCMITLFMSVAETHKK